MRLHAWTVGDGPRTAALVHGATQAADAWRDVAKILVDEYDLTVFLLDQRGLGRDVRVKPGAVHDMHLQDPPGVVATLDDVPRAPA